MKVFLFIILACLMVGCNTTDKGAEQEKGKTNGDSILNQQSETQGSPTINAVLLSAAQVPARIKFRGTLYEAWQWTDKTGDNILITSIVPPYPDKYKGDDDEEVRTAELHAFHFQKKDTGYKLLWKISDAEKTCGFDITSGFIKGSTIITDLNNNGIAETTVQYKLACRSDVSPANMKLIMHEDTVKYSLRGIMWISQGQDEQFTITGENANLEKIPKKKDEYEQMMQSFGRYETEREFTKGPPEFLLHARTRWLKFAIESFE